MPTILAATDLSVRSDRALARAARLARLLNWNLRVLSVVDDDVPARLAAARREAVSGELDRLLAGLGTLPEGATADAVLGDVAEAIPAEAAAEDVALVVLGLHRPRPFLDRLRETTMERLVRLVPRPVLLVRDPAAADYARVLAPVSFSASCAAAVTAARRIAPGAEVTMIHAQHLPFAGLTGERPGGAMDRALQAEATAAAAAWIARSGLAEGLPGPLLETGSLGEVIGAAVEAMHPDLIALGAHTRGGIAPYALGGFAADMIREPPADLLIARGTG